MKTYSYDIQVRFRDCDGLGHINNAVYHSYIEACRTHWLDDTLAVGAFSRGEPIPIILARTEIDFLAQGHLNHTITVHSWLVHVGSKSFHQQYEIRNKDQILAKAKAVLVWFDFDQQESVAIPADKRQVMMDYLKLAVKEGKKS